MRAQAIVALRAEAAVRSRSPGADGVLGSLAACEPDVAAVGARSLPALLAALEHPPPGGVPRWKLTEALLRRFDLDEIVGIGLAASLTPALLSVAGRLEWGRGGPWRDAEDFATDLVTETWLVLHQLAGRTVAYPERTVVDRVRRRLAHRRTDFRTGARRECPADPELLEGQQGSAGVGEPPSRATTLDQLAVALSRSDDRIVAREDVRLVFQTRVLGYSIAELAAGGAGCRRTLEHRRGRAEAALCV